MANFLSLSTVYKAVTDLYVWSLGRNIDADGFTANQICTGIVNIRLIQKLLSLMLFLLVIFPL